MDEIRFGPSANALHYNAAGYDGEAKEWILFVVKFYSLCL